MPDEIKINQTKEIISSSFESSSQDRANIEKKSAEKEVFNNDGEKQRERSQVLAEINNRGTGQNSSVQPGADFSLEKRAKEIEKVLESNMEQIYFSLDSDQQKKFRVSGEETARAISRLLNETRIKIKKIINLVRKWLKQIPGANKFFLEQEAKIKADEIIKLKDLY